MNLFDNFNLPPKQEQQLKDYSTLMLRWNERIQMTATKDLDAFVSRHVLDSLALAEHIPEGEGTMIDVGSGGGLPGIVLSIVRPDIEFTLIEPTKKKHAFLSAARRELKLTNLKTMAVRDEELKEMSSFTRYDYAVARAVWALETWMLRGQSLVKLGGIVFGMEGLDEVELTGNMQRFRYQLAGDRQRAIVTLKTVT